MRITAYHCGVVCYALHLASVNDISRILTEATDQLLVISRPQSRPVVVRLDQLEVKLHSLSHMCRGICVADSGRIGGMLTSHWPMLSASRRLRRHLGPVVANLAGPTLSNCFRFAQ